MAEWSKAPALGAGPKGRGFEPHCCQVKLFFRGDRQKAMTHPQLHQGACGVVVSRLLCMQKASGSNPDKSTIFLPHLKFSC